MRQRVGSNREKLRVNPAWTVPRGVTGGIPKLQTVMQGKLDDAACSRGHSLKANVPSCAIDDQPGDGKAQARATAGRRFRRAAGVKALEDGFLLRDKNS